MTSSGSVDNACKVSSNSVQWFRSFESGTNTGHTDKRSLLLGWNLTEKIMPLQFATLEDKIESPSLFLTAIFSQFHFFDEFFAIFLHLIFDDFFDEVFDTGKFFLS